MKEVFKDVPGYEGLYQVSDLGRVKSLDRVIKHSHSGYLTLKEMMLKSGVNGRGYLSVVLCNGNQKSYKVSVLVAMAFLDHKPKGYKIVVDHINAIKTDDRLKNLQLITQRENSSKEKKGYSSKYIGVSRFARDNKWQASIRINGKSKNLGHFDCEIKAAEAYKTAFKIDALKEVLEVEPE